MSLEKLKALYEDVLENGLYHVPEQIKWLDRMKTFRGETKLSATAKRIRDQTLKVTEHYGFNIDDFEDEPIDWPSIQTDNSFRLAPLINLACKGFDQLGLRPKQPLFIGVYPTLDLNAIILPDKDGYLCLYNYGMIRFLFVASYTCCLWCYNEGETRVESTPHKIKACSNILELHVSHLVNQNKIFAIQPDNMTISDDGLLMANQLALSAKLFVLAHEIAHVVLDHQPAGSTSKVLSHEQEYEADELAQKVLCEIPKASLPCEVVYGGLAFLLLRKAYEYGLLAIDREFAQYFESSATHPQTYNRIRRLDDLLSDTLREEDRLRLAPVTVIQRIVSNMDKKYKPKA